MTTRWTAGGRPGCCLYRERAARATCAPAYPRTSVVGAGRKAGEQGARLLPGDHVALALSRLGGSLEGWDGVLTSVGKQENFGEGPVCLAEREEVV
jgi:hypothetical protein